jgi:hypothetical protein
VFEKQKESEKERAKNFLSCFSKMEDDENLFLSAASLFSVSSSAIAIAAV